MSFYRVVYEGNELWVPGTEDVIDPVVEVELNTAGRLTMTLLPNHPDFYAIQPLLGTVEVWEDNELIWFGRPVYQERTIKNHKPVYCEGALAYFNDSAQRPRAKGPVTAAALFADILSVHNSQVPANRQFAQGTVDVPSTEIIWENDYEESMHTLQTLLQAAGGYVIPRRSGSTNYLDYRYDLPLNDGQPIRFQLNMTDFNRRYSFEEKFTTVLPIGGVPEPTEQVPEPGVTTIAPVNAGSDILDGPDAATYGRIIKVLKYPIITDPQELYDTAARVLEYVEFHPISIHAKAVDLSMLDSFYQRFRVGCQYHVLSEAHDVDAWVPMTKLTIRMDRAVREIEVGTVRRAGLSEMLNRQNRQLDYLKQTFAPKVGGRDWNSRAEVSVNPRRYTVVFMNGDTVLQEVKNVAPGDSVTYSGQTPTRAGCEFIGWDKEAVNVHSNLVIYAQFTKLAYTVTFKNWDGTTLAVVDDVPYDGTAVYPGETPTKEGKRFKGWQPLPVHIREDTVCIAQFFEIDREKLHYDLSHYFRPVQPYNSLSGTRQNGAFAVTPQNNANPVFFFVGPSSNVVSSEIVFPLNLNNNYFYYTSKGPFNLLLETAGSTSVYSAEPYEHEGITVYYARTDINGTALTLNITDYACDNKYDRNKVSWDLMYIMENDLG